MNSTSATLLTSTQMVGRTTPLAMLKQSIARAGAGNGTTVLIGGEAGVGKSRLVAEIIATTPPDSLLRGSCFESDRAVPYAPILDLLQMFIAQESAGTLASLLGVHAGNLAALIPQLDTLIPSPAPLLEPELEKRRVFESLIAFVTTRAESAATRLPLLIIIEDVHWSDDTSLEFLLLLARRIQSHPILLLLTYRHDEVPPRLSQIISTLERGRLATDIRLNRLSEPEVALMMQTIFTLPHPPRPDFLHSIYTLTDGNPFFVEEILRSLVSRGEIVSMNGVWQRRAVEQLQIPRTVEDAVLQRMGRLSTEAKAAIALAAVVGRRFDFELLQELTGHDEITLLALLKEMLAAQLVREETADVWMFRHALTQQAIYHQLLARERRLLHRTVGDTIERSHAGAVGELAHHFGEAHVWDKTLRYATLAGDQARRLDAMFEAIEQWTRALTAAVHRSDVAAQAALYLARGSANNHVGEWENARLDYDHALTLARQLGAHDLEAQALIELGLLWSARDYREAKGFLVEALTISRTIGDDALIARSLNRYGNWLLNSGQPMEAQKAHREALARFESLQEPQGIAHTYDLLAIACYHAGEVLSGIEYFQTAITLWRQIGNRLALAESLMQFTVRVHIDTEVAPLQPVPELYAQIDEALQIVREIHWRSGEAEAFVLRGIIGVYAARYGNVFSDYPLALTLAQEIEHHQWYAAGRAGFGFALLDMLVPEEAARYLEPSFEAVRHIHARLWLYQLAGFMISLYALRGEWEVIETLCSELIVDNHFDHLPNGLRHVWCAKGEAALLQGNVQEALRIAEGLIENTLEATPESVVPRLWLLRGAALTALDRAGEAEPILQSALQWVTIQQAERYIWRIELALGHCYASRGKQTLATRTFASVRAEVNRLADTIPDPEIQARFRERAIALLPAARVPTPRQAAKQEAGGLTEREREVVRLITEGKSNREIAETLVVAERTIASHVSNILNKLGFDSRVQIAMWEKERSKE